MVTQEGRTPSRWSSLPYSTVGRRQHCVTPGTGPCQHRRCGWKPWSVCGTDAQTLDKAGLGLALLWKSTFVLYYINKIFMMYKMFVSFFVPLLIVLCKAFGDWMDVFICKDSSLPWVVTANLEQALYIARKFLTLYIALYLFTLNSSAGHSVSCNSTQLVLNAVSWNNLGSLANTVTSLICRSLMNTLNTSSSRPDPYGNTLLPL